MPLKHVLLKSPRLKGLEYGMLRSLEEEIVTRLSADVVEIPEYTPVSIAKLAGHGMRWNSARNFLPKRKLKIDADVIWYILVGPENYELDLFEDWDMNAKYRIVYLFDTLEPQFPLIKKLFSSDKFNVCITSFEDAVPHLEKMTNHVWHAIEQAAPSSWDKEIGIDQRLIAFSSYGRRINSFHHQLYEFCISNNLYYDYSVHTGKCITVTSEELYNQYSWHLNHSLFTVSWPVEMTNPTRAGILRPITCRWFEAASSGTVILGQKPGNDTFDYVLNPDLVVSLDPLADKKIIWSKLESIYENRLSYYLRAREIQKENRERWSWSNRISRILKLLK